MGPGLRSLFVFDSFNWEEPEPVFMLAEWSRGKEMNDGRGNS